MNGSGRIQKIPNFLIIGSPIVNHSKFFPHVWNERFIILTPDANWVKAKSIFQQLTEKYTKAYEGSARAAIGNAKNHAQLMLHKTSPKVYVTLQHEAPAGITLTSRFFMRSTRYPRYGSAHFRGPFGALSQRGGYRAGI